MATQSLSSIGTSYWAFVLSCTSHCRSQKLIDTAPMTVVPLAWVSFLGRSRDLLLADHTHQLLRLHQPVDPGHPLIGGDGRKSLQSLEVLVNKYDRLFVLLHCYPLVANCLDCIHYTVRDYSVQYIYHVLFIGDAFLIAVSKVLGDLRPLSPVPTTPPYSCGRKLLPVRQILNP